MDTTVNYTINFSSHKFNPLTFYFVNGFVDTMGGSLQRSRFLGE